ncbi:MAG: hypothetical protein KUG77_22975 [Nannocystaceae bacterium]|nr:hypothetical protein [Nannocystaceae bacterium]
MRPGTSRILLTVSVLCIASNGCVRWGEKEEEDDQAGCGSDSSAPADDSVTTDPTFPKEDDDMDESDTRGTRADPTIPDLPQWPTPWPLDAEAAVVVWGKTGIPTKNLDLVRNIYLSLAAGGEPYMGSSSTGSPAGETSSSTEGTTGGADTDAAGTTGGVDTDSATEGTGEDTDGTGGDTEGTEPDPGVGVNILWVADCDPRTDVVGCLAGNVQPYFAMVDTIGSIDFKPLSEVDPLAYDVVVADFCGPVSATAVGEMLGEGARVLVLGDTWCVRDGQTSAAAANELLEHIGTRFDGAELYNHGFLVSEARRVGILEGIDSIDAWGVGLQGLGPEFDELLGTSAGTLLSSRN